MTPARKPAATPATSRLGAARRPATPVARRARGARIGLALAGGGPLGAIYEIGALCALDDALCGIDLTQLDHYVGVSAGGFIAAGLANGMSPRELCAAFIQSESSNPDVFDPAWLMVPAYAEFAHRAARLPALACRAALGSLLRRKSVSDAIESFAASLPTGLFSNDEIHRRLGQTFSRAGRSNDFRRLRGKLTLIATDLDNGTAAPFGRPGWDEVPISLAVQASAALPGLFPPVSIGGRHYVDGALKKTMHASVALDDGVDLLLCLNPLVPFDIGLRRDGSGVPVPRVFEGGLPAVLSQTFRTLIHSRMELGMKHYEKVYPGSDIVLLEPDRADAEFYLASTFSYRQRRRLAENAYQQTLAALRERRQEIGAKLMRHGVSMRDEVIADAGRGLFAASKASRRHQPGRLGPALMRLNDSLDELRCTLAGADRLVV